MGGSWVGGSWVGGFWAAGLCDQQRGGEVCSQEELWLCLYLERHFAPVGKFPVSVLDPALPGSVWQGLLAAPLEEAVTGSQQDPALERGCGRSWRQAWRCLVHGQPGPGPPAGAWAQGTKAGLRLSSLPADADEEEEAQLEHGLPFLHSLAPLVVDLLTAAMLAGVRWCLIVV